MPLAYKQIYGVLIYLKVLQQLLRRNICVRYKLVYIETRSVYLANTQKLCNS